MSEVAEQIRDLIDSCVSPIGADQAIALSRSRLSELAGDRHSTVPMTRNRPRHLRRLSVLGAGAVLAAAIALVLLELVPGSVQREPQAAAAELHEIALNAARQSVPELANGQYLFTQQQVTFFANSIGTQEGRSPEAQASATATIKEWANDTGGSCIEATSGQLTFASPVNKQAWLAAGLLVNPTSPTSSVCQFRRYWGHRRVEASGRPRSLGQRTECGINRHLDARSGCGGSQCRLRPGRRFSLSDPLSETRQPLTALSSKQWPSSQG